ncbi:MAG: formate dehydrogenase accessory sulfurtransferase FdhD [Verrucomicrobiae bacterium]|nr:formate dehydrogenase accessory sulfurtransferase FdhD [Verrucomicrobiae bacterium]
MRVRIRRVEASAERIVEDVVATEEPLEIRVASGGQTHPAAVTMRTPGNDFELAAGFLLSESVIRSREEIRAIRYCAEPQNYNVVTVHLEPGVLFDPAQLSRHVYTTSSCGICGKASLERVRAVCGMPVVQSDPLPATFFRSLPRLARAEQSVFARTGGLHATAIFDREGRLQLLREDVGRHNAMDKAIGRLLLDGRLPGSELVAWVSGRASFELVQKAVMAGIPVLASVGAPSSLAVDLAREMGLQLVGFVREDRCNIYTPDTRVERGV